MFDKQYRFTGSHAEKVSALTSIFDETSKGKFFVRNLDVYLNAPLVGFLFNRKGEKNSQSEIAPQNIFPEQMIHESEQLKYNLRLIMLLDEQYEKDANVRLDKAFRCLGDDKADLEVFDAYVLGGVDVLYEKLIEEASDATDYVSNMFDFTEDFQSRFNENIHNLDVLELCRSNDAD